MFEDRREHDYVVVRRDDSRGEGSVGAEGGLCKMMKAAKKHCGFFEMMSMGEEK